MKKKITALLLGLCSLCAVSVYAVNPTTKQPTQTTPQTCLQTSTCTPAPCYQIPAQAVCAPVPCDTTVNCTSVPCAPVPCDTTVYCTPAPCVVPTTVPTNCGGC